MLTLSKDQITKLRTLLKSEVGKSLLQDFKDIIVKTDNYPANATDGMLFALLEGRREGELSVLRQLIKIGESNE